MGRSGSACGASSIVRAGRSHVIYKLSGVITLHCLMTEMMFGHTLMSWDKTITACEVAQRERNRKVNLHVARCGIFQEIPSRA